MADPAQMLAAGEQHAGIVIVGSGLAAVCALEGMREAGYLGQVTMIGEERQMPYDRPPLSKQVLKEPGAEARIDLRDSAIFEAPMTRLLRGRCVAEIDVHRSSVVLDDGAVVGYEKLLLATGSRPRVLPGLPPAGAGVFYLRTLDDAVALRGALKSAKSLAVVGGGVIGLEVAATAVGLGVETTVIEASPRLMSRAACTQLSQVLDEEHRAHGVHVQCGAIPSAFEFSRNRHTISWSDGRTLEVDLVLVGVGVIPEIGLAERCGIECAAGGIRVDGFGVTSIPGIYAAGEVAFHYNGRVVCHQRQENWHHAAAHGRHVGAAMIKPEGVYQEICGYWSDQYDLNIQVFGAVTGDEHVVRGDISARRFAIFHLSDGVVVGITAVNSPSDLRLGKKLVRAGSPLEAEVESAVRA
ncbi:NAD(P)/FAD-dependent oxidoreductase [Variovorax sp. E3]|uniref:NAD(P)/FAD-dependent oxidoreductase n=1 Tax=Variovorax sp. E3 TaxID=1914993 RepID=UPI0018DE8B05|nr:FAD-dependent oxidoreductase [Variovorax sp. E3]